MRVLDLLDKFADGLGSTGSDVLAVAQSAGTSIFGKR